MEVIRYTRLKRLARGKLRPLLPKLLPDGSNWQLIYPLLTVDSLYYKTLRVCKVQKWIDCVVSLVFLGVVSYWFEETH
jgi:hypothetical protein